MNSVPTISLLLFFDFFLRHPMRLDDFPLPGIIEFQREKKSGIERVGHFARVVPSRDDPALNHIEQRGVGVDPSLHSHGLPNEPQV